MVVIATERSRLRGGHPRISPPHHQKPTSSRHHRMDIAAPAIKTQVVDVVGELSKRTSSEKKSLHSSKIIIAQVK